MEVHWLRHVLHACSHTVSICNHIAVQYRIKVFLKAHSLEMIKTVAVSAPQATITALEAKELLFQKNIENVLTHLVSFCEFLRSSAGYDIHPLFLCQL